MTQILDKFIKKLEKIQKYNIIYKDDENVLFMVPIKIEIIVHYKNIASCIERKEPEPRFISTIMLCTTNLKSPLSVSCRKAKMLVGKISDDTIQRNLEDTEEYIDGATMQHYDLNAKKGDGHQ